MIQFSIQLKSGATKDALALIVGYGKEFNGHRFVYSTGLKVARKSFKPEKPGRELKHLLEVADKAYASIMAAGEALNNESLKSRISLFINRVQWKDNELHIYSQGVIERYHIPEGVNRAVVSKELNNELLKANPSTKDVIASLLSAGRNELFGFWQGVIDGTIKPRHGKALRGSTLSAKKQTFRVLSEYQQKIGSLTFQRMDMSFYNNFTGWLSKEKGFDANTIGKHIKELKSILHLAYSNELLKNDRFKYWPVTKESNEVVTLSKDEVLKIAAIDLAGTKANVRDIFVLACFLGARISDFKSFRKESLSASGGITFFEYVQEKTGSRVKIPVHPIALQILDRREGEFPKMISEQNFRNYLKEICQAAEFNDRVITKIRDGQPEYKMKWEAISPHSARRTFASSLFYGWFGKPMPASLAMRYTGHKTEKSFLLYIGANENDLDKKALEYFTVQPQLKVS